MAAAAVDDINPALRGAAAGAAAAAAASVPAKSLLLLFLELGPEKEPLPAECCSSWLLPFPLLLPGTLLGLQGTQQTPRTDADA